MTALNPRILKTLDGTSGSSGRLTLSTIEQEEEERERKEKRERVEGHFVALPQSFLHFILM